MYWQATRSTRQRIWYLSCHPFLFIYVYVFLYVLYTFFWFGLLQRLYRNFKLFNTQTFFAYKAVCRNERKWLWMSWLCFVISFRFQDTLKVSSLSENVSRRQSRNENLRGAYLFPYGNLAEVDMTGSRACIGVGLPFQYRWKSKNISGWLFATGFLVRI